MGADHQDQSCEALSAEILTGMRERQTVAAT
jgi:hypothetical protein